MHCLEMRVPHKTPSRGKALLVVDSVNWALFRCPAGSRVGSWSRQQCCRRAYWLKTSFVCTPSLVQAALLSKGQDEVLNFWNAKVLNIPELCFILHVLSGYQFKSLAGCPLWWVDEQQWVWNNLKKILVCAVARTAWLVWKTACPHSSSGILDYIYFCCWPPFLTGGEEKGPARKAVKSKKPDLIVSGCLVL